jgi:hypothetical protein
MLAAFVHCDNVVDQKRDIMESGAFVIHSAAISLPLFLFRPAKGLKLDCTQMCRRGSAATDPIRPKEGTHGP